METRIKHCEHDVRMALLALSQAERVAAGYIRNVELSRLILAERERDLASAIQDAARESERVDEQTPSLYR